VPFRLAAVSDLRRKQGVGSTFEAPRQPIAYPDEIDSWPATAAGWHLVKHSFFSLDETSATYEVLVV
jgi:hypothetical protein